MKEKRNVKVQVRLTSADKKCLDKLTSRQNLSISDVFRSTIQKNPQRYDMNQNKKTDKKTDKVIDSIEQTPAKANIRQDIVSQTMQYLDYKETVHEAIKTLEGVTLPGSHWYFEHSLISSVNHSHLRRVPKIRMHGVELEPHRAKEAIRNRPPNCSITYGSYDDFLAFDPNLDHYDIGVLDFKRKSPLMINFAWADYCRPVNLESLISFAKMLGNNTKEGIFYLTLSLKSRQLGGGESILSELRDYSSSQDIQQAVITTLNNLFKKYAKHQNIKLIYDVVYGGGKIEITTMLTLGYSVNLPTRAIKAIVENRREIKKDTKAFNQRAYDKMRFYSSWNEYGEDKRRSTAKVSNVDEERLNLGVKRWEYGWKHLSTEKKNQIACRYGVTLQSFASKVAWYHGKLAHKSKKFQKAA